MKFQNISLFFLFAISINCFGQDTNMEKKDVAKGEMMVRIAELEIDPNAINEYLNILKEEAEASVRLEPGVICIYPMYQKENPTQIRLLEIYANKAAYESHLQTSHFKKYKTSTLAMVKDLKLIDMQAIDPESMAIIFNKLKQ
ncbi:putative quinol monooxygenase [Maribacter arenosus]|uniref:Antibiotic biosynthesis monooxygenase n=1 Tax=Maribacter arenosus TaxID=1854708 RepID=A0ABR7VHE1_9FLAO|nr:putative quinol monooxygenase [Maribacter arenosus]MBD0851803.1 antibiotic biosynthesis monooxygenase [Maribacter arenosus]